MIHLQTTPTDADDPIAAPASATLTSFASDHRLGQQIRQSCALLNIPDDIFLAVFGEWVRVLLKLKNAPTILDDDRFADLMTQFCEGQDV